VLEIRIMQPVALESPPAECCCTIDQLKNCFCFGKKSSDLILDDHSDGGKIGEHNNTT
jgi:hypothetical protein